MPRLPPAAWILAPLAAAGGYALLHPVLVPRPTVANLIPAEAVLSHRFRTAEDAERSFPWPLLNLFLPLADPRAPGRAPILEDIARLRNVPGLPGVDRGAPFHWVFLPRAGRPDATMAIFSLDDPSAFEARFRDPDHLFDRGFVRHAQNLEVRDGFGAVAWDRYAVKRIGGGGITAEDRGEDHALALHVPGILEFALQAPVEPPWRDLLEALGYRGDEPVVLTHPETGEPLPALAVPAGRVLRVHAAWRTLRCWSWTREGRIRIDLEPAPGALADLLVGAARAPGASIALPAPPPGACASLVVPDGEALPVVVRALHDLGADLPEAAIGDRGPSRSPGAAGVVVWAEQSTSHAHAWNLAVASPTPADLAALAPALAGPAGTVDPLAEGTAPVLVYDGKYGRPSPVATSVRSTVEGTAIEVLAVGPEADRIRISAADPTWSPPSAPEAGWRLLAAFALDEPRASKLLRGLLGPRGFLGTLDGGDISGEAWTDGRTLRIEARAARRP